MSFVDLLFLEIVKKMCHKFGIYVLLEIFRTISRSKWANISASIHIQYIEPVLFSFLHILVVDHGLQLGIK